MLFSCEVVFCVPVLETFLQVRALEDSRRDLTFEVTSDILTNNRSSPSPSGDGIPSSGMWMILCCHWSTVGESLILAFISGCSVGSDTGSNYGHTLSFHWTHPIWNKDMFQCLSVVITTQVPTLMGRRHLASCLLGNLRS